ncbi:DUF3618 domain-containing protein [Arthrobacter sp. H14]|uniref:DUF3618 domain-containing protein n=1 Tax=Arthrobacter sp. H14 TaxID=1312959 RepID=UPI0004B31DC1|nr:DUF3618 domain-containing protein [Arthrobacter sp. H14]
MNKHTTPHTPEPGKDAETSEIQADIDATRAELGHTVEQLSERLDVKKQAKQKADAYKAHAAEAVDSTKRQALGIFAATGAKTRELTGSREADPAADRRRGGITLGSGALLVCALIAGVLIWRHQAKAHKTSLPTRSDITKQMRSARKNMPDRRHKTGLMPR